MSKIKDSFIKDGFVKVDELISQSEMEHLRKLYDELLGDKQKTAGLRSDLSGGKERDGVEKITQIMCPSVIEPELLKSIVFNEALNWAKVLLGDDLELDFDMLINKAPYTDTPTPWHQDAAYWMKIA